MLSTRLHLLPDARKHLAGMYWVACTESRLMDVFSYWKCVRHLGEATYFRLSANKTGHPRFVNNQLIAEQDFAAKQKLFIGGKPLYWNLYRAHVSLSYIERNFFYWSAMVTHGLENKSKSIVYKWKHGAMSSISFICTYIDYIHTSW